MNSVKQSFSFVPNIPENNGRPILKILAASKNISENMNACFFRSLFFFLFQLYIQFISYNRHLPSSYYVPGTLLDSGGTNMNNT